MDRKEYIISNGDKKTKYTILITNCEGCNIELRRNPYYISPYGYTFCKKCAGNYRKEKNIINIQDYKICATCFQHLSIDKFKKYDKNNNYNKSCTRCYALKKYGINSQDYKKLLQNQNNVCAICKGEETIIHKNETVSSLSVDHCHTTGKVRGLLCSNCNRAMGLFKDSSNIIKEALNYLQNSK